MRVPVRAFGTRPPLRVSPDLSWNDASGPSPEKTPGTPRRKLMPCCAGVRSTSTSSRADSALTTEAPTPCRPPVATYDEPPNLPPACSLVKTTSTPGEPGLGLLVDRDAAPVVVHLGRAVGVEGDLDQVAGAGQRLVHAVVDDLPQAVHEPAGVGGPDVHARALADRLQPLEDEEVCCVVGVVGDRAAPESCLQSAFWSSPRRSGGRARSRLPATRRAPVQARCRGGRESGSTVATSRSGQDSAPSSPELNRTRAAPVTLNTRDSKHADAGFSMTCDRA